MDRAMLAGYRIDYDKGLANCVGDVAFYKLLLSMFLDDESFPKAKKAFEAGDNAALFTCLHELKGVTGNAGLTGLYETVSAAVEVLRKGSADTTALPHLFAAVDDAYERTCTGIRLALQQ